ncbi:lipopolysaccharide assembly protein LapA domain-containing protein [Agrilactobacillus fermenti]|uniref:lipopolysaccharide assembly protein LapA domain-containing protein n=1 Tax=Agrilactobacillus fermenti TaxID=2586909 RepID=UPI001E3DC998|nr:lipopolysaccharide assembly protein LapA domain-containing protein [Agrilactobacillus fermenti]MCD2255235.1 DUF1049 domain-containing protein [Agrilactobacillus fermenti]
MKKQRNFILGLIIAVILVVFALINQKQVQISFGFTIVKLPLILILFISILLGALVTYLFATMGNYNMKKQLKHLTTQIDDADKIKQAAVAEAITTTTKKLDQQYQAELAKKDEKIKQLQVQSNGNAQQKGQLAKNQFDASDK